MIIYKIVNSITSDFYIGKTTGSLELRWQKHCRNSSNCRYLSNAIKKYGKSSFRLEVLKVCQSLEDLNISEKHFIKTMSPLYNLTKGGDGGALIGESLERMKIGVSKALKGKKKPHRTLEHSNKISKSLTGKPNMKKRIPIKCSNGLVYSGIKEASKLLNISAGNIHSVLKGYRKTAGGYSFGYI